MKTSVGPRQNYMRKKANAKDNKSCSLFKVLVSLLIFAWSAFVYICWKYGYFHSSAYIDSLKNASGTLRGSIDKLSSHIPKTYVPKSEVLNIPSDVKEGDNIHVIFSTDCGTYQDWQTLVVFYSATMAGQRGQITRIASGCDAEKKEVLTALYKKLYPAYHVHFTPDFKKDGKSQKSCTSSSIEAHLFLYS